MGLKVIINITQNRLFSFIPEYEVVDVLVVLVEELVVVLVEVEVLVDFVTGQIRDISGTTGVGD